MGHLRRALGIALAAVCLVGTLTTPASATAPGGNGKIYFSARVDGASNDNEILAVNPDGTGLTNVTPPFVHVPGEFDGDNWGPALTGDGSQFVWLTDRCWATQPTPYCGTHQIGIANADGSGAQRLTDLTSSDQETATVSSDGTMLAFSSDRGGCCEIWIEDLVSGSLTEVTHTGQTNTSNPVFSPDGKQLAYNSNGHVWIVDLGTGITVDLGSGGQPTWSPDGTQVAFASGRSGASEIWRSKLDGSGAVQLTFLGCNESNPSWSPDGRLIVFHDNCDGGLDIASAVDGTGRYMVIGDHTPYQPVGEPELPSWQPLPAPAPTVTATTPPDGATDVSADTAVSATFSRAIDPATITTASFTLAGPAGPVAATVAYDAPTATATLIPASPLAAGTTYAVTLASTIRSADGTPLAAPITWTFTTAVPPAPPTVVATSPVDGATGVAADAAIGVTFSRAMDASTITSASFTLTGLGATAATIAYDPLTRTATLRPLRPLADGRTYTASLDTTVESADGVPLASVYSWSFTTEPGPLLLVSATPADGATKVPTDAPITATFNKPLDPDTVNQSNITLFGPSTIGINAAIEYVPGSTTLTIVGGNAIKPGEPYMVELGPNLRAADGTHLGTFASWSWTTLNVPPSVTSVSPPDGATFVATTTAVTATFSRFMDPATITSASFSLGAVPATVTYDAATETATLKPLRPLLEGTTYTATLDTTVASSDGVPLTAPYSWSFSTVPTPLRLVSTTPADGSTALADTPITATFNKPLDPATVNQSSVALFLDAGTEVTIAVEYVPGSTTVTIDPGPGRIKPGNGYMVEIGQNIRAADGAAPSAPLSWSWVAADPTPPVIEHQITGTLGDNGWYTSDVTLTWTVLEPETPGTLVETGCATQTITRDQPDRSYFCTATSFGGTTGPVEVRIKRDATPPTVTYANNAGVYTVDQEILITCSAADALSGVVSTTCRNVVGPAYSFATGTTTVSATARDAAGNSTFASTSFTVTVTRASLVALVDRFVTDAGVARSLAAKVASIDQASTVQAARGKLVSFDNELAAQAGKTLTKAEAAVLERLAAAL